MDPPSYEEASSQNPAQVNTRPRLSSPLPPANDVPVSSPSTPPPSYGDAVQQDPFPVLTPPSLPTTGTRQTPDSGIILHPVSQIGVTPPVRTTQAQTVVVVSQPQGVPISVESLGDKPALVNCPHCGHQAVSKVRYSPGATAWWTCVLLALLGLICGFCLIPLMMRSMQDAHHSCSKCKKELHVHRR